MIKLLISIILFSSTSFGAVIDDNCALKKGGRCFTKAQVDASTFKILKTWATTSGNGVFFEGMTQTGYQVPADTQLNIMVVMHENTASGGNIYYTDDDIGPSTATVGTNPVYLMDDGVNAQLTTQATVNRAVEMPVKIVVPTGKYINWNGATSGNWSVTIIGIEESTL